MHGGVSGEGASWVRRRRAAGARGSDPPLRAGTRCPLADSRGVAAPPPELLPSPGRAAPGAPYASASARPA